METGIRFANIFAKLSLKTRVTKYKKITKTKTNICQSYLLSLVPDYTNSLTE